MPADLVLMYHSVEPYTADPYQVTVHPDRFARQLRWLRRRGLRGVSMRELLAARRDGTARGLVGLTFDDGYACAVGATADAGAVGATADAGRYALPRTFVGDRDTAPRLWAKWARHGLRRGSRGLR